MLFLILFMHKYYSHDCLKLHVKTATHVCMYNWTYMSGLYITTILHLSLGTLSEPHPASDSRMYISLFSWEYRRGSCVASRAALLIVTGVSDALPVIPHAESVVIKNKLTFCF